MAKNTAPVQNWKDKALAMLHDGYEAYKKIGETYDSLLSILQAEGVKWEKVYDTLRDLFPEWPRDEKNESFKGLTKTLKEHPDYLPAQWLNRFNAYRNGKYSNFGVAKVKQTKAAKQAGEKAKKTADKAKSEAAGITADQTQRIGKPFIVDKAMMKHNLQELAVFIMYMGKGSSAARKHLEELAKVLGVNTEELPMTAEQAEKITATEQEAA